MEEQGSDFRHRLREGFLAEAAASGGRIHVIDARGTVDEVHAVICAIAEPIISVQPV
jgi:thymidylate kinase